MARMPGTNPIAQAVVVQAVPVGPVRTMRVVIPENAAPGSTLTVLSPEGIPVKVQVPPQGIVGVMNFQQHEITVQY